MKYNSSNFFDKNFDYYGDKKLYYYDYYLLKFIKNNGKNSPLNFLDIGGADGTFANLVVTECPKIEVTLLDPSKKMLDKINNNKIQRIKGIIPNICLNSIFNFIHIKEVLHHITGASIHESKDLSIKSLQNINKILSDDGFLFVHELYYESPVIPAFTSTLIFYILRIQNKYGIKIPSNHFRKGLNVYFYTRKELRRILNNCGYEIVDYYEETWNTTYIFQKRLLFLKDWGRMVFICQKKQI